MRKLDVSVMGSLSHLMLLINLLLLPKEIVAPANVEFANPFATDGPQGIVDEPVDMVGNKVSSTKAVKDERIGTAQHNLRMLAIFTWLIGTHITVGTVRSVKINLFQNQTPVEAIEMLQALAGTEKMYHKNISKELKSEMEKEREEHGGHVILDAPLKRMENTKYAVTTMKFAAEVAKYLKKNVKNADGRLRQGYSEEDEKELADVEENIRKFWVEFHRIIVAENNEHNRSQLQLSDGKTITYDDFPPIPIIREFGFLTRPGEWQRPKFCTDQDLPPAEHKFCQALELMIVLMEHVKCNVQKHTTKIGFFEKGFLPGGEGIVTHAEKAHDLDWIKDSWLDLMDFGYQAELKKSLGEYMEELKKKPSFKCYKDDHTGWDEKEIEKAKAEIPDTTTLAHTRWAEGMISGASKEFQETVADAGVQQRLNAEKRQAIKQGKAPLDVNDLHTVVEGLHTKLVQVRRHMVKSGKISVNHSEFPTDVVPKDFFSPIRNLSSVWKGTKASV